MDTKIPPARPDTVVVQTAPRPTPTPTRVSFRDVVRAGAGGIVRGAEIAMGTLPGSPLMAVSVRGPAAGGMRTTAAPEGPGGAGVAGGVGVGVGGVGVGGVGVGGVGVGGATGVGAGATGAPQDGGVEASLAQAQEMNLYYLQIQEQVNAQNRTFTTLSNVLKAEHDTVKTAIGNIR
jgi:hypothetical protein